MATYTITTSESLDTALAYQLEQVNVQRALSVDPVLDPLTMEEYLQERVNSDLQSVLTNLDSIISSSLSNLLALKDNTVVFNAILETIESPAMLARVNQLTA